MTADFQQPDLPADADLKPSLEPSANAWATEQLERLEHFRYPSGNKPSPAALTKMQVTALALAWARIMPTMTEADVWRDNATASKQTYYKPDGWRDNPLFTDVLDQLTRQARRWYSGRAQRAIKATADDLAIAGPAAVAKLVQIMGDPDLSAKDTRLAAQAILSLLKGAGGIYHAEPDPDQQQLILHRFDLSTVGMDVLHGLMTNDGPPSIAAPPGPTQQEELPPA